MNLSHRQRFIDGFGHFSLGILSGKIQLFISAWKMASSTSCVKSKMLWCVPNIVDHISMEAFVFVYLPLKTDLWGEIQTKPLELNKFFFFFLLFPILLDLRWFASLQTQQKDTFNNKNMRFYHFWFYYAFQTLLLIMYDNNSKIMPFINYLVSQPQRWMLVVWFYRTWFTSTNT